jgi:hypothetical protein
MGKLRSNRVKRTPQTGITSDRYQFLGLEQAEPNLGDPRVGPSSVGVNPIKVGLAYQNVSINGHIGERFWTPLVGFGTTVGVISVYANGTLVNNDNRFQTINGLNFVGTGVTVESLPTEGPFQGVGIATVRFTVTDIQNKGQIGQVLYNTPSGYAYGADDLYYVSGNVGIGSTLPRERLDVSGNGYFIGTVTAATFIGEFAGTATTAKNVIGGIASVTSLYVSGISTLGVTSATDLTSKTLVVSGISTLGPIQISTSGSTGIVSAISGINTLFYYGDGSKLTEVVASRFAGIATVAVLTNNDDKAQYLTFVAGAGIVTQFSVDTNIGLVFNPSTERLGIGTTNPKATLDVGVGSVHISNGDFRLNGNPYIFNTRDAGGGYVSNGGTDGILNFNNITPGGPIGLSVKIPGVGATVGTFESPNTDNLYITMSTRHDGTRAISYFNGLLGIGTTNPSTPLDVYTNRGSIKVGVITAQPSTDSGVLFSGLGTYTSSIFTEVNGEVLSYGINVAQIISPRDSSKVGGIFRLDTRTITGHGSSTLGDNSCFVVKYAPVGVATTTIGLESGQKNGIIISLENGQTYLVPDGGNTLIGVKTDTGTSNQRLQVNGGAYISGNLGIGTTVPTSTVHIVGNGVPTEATLQVDGNIRIGISTTSNYIAFRGVQGDGVGETPPVFQPSYTHAYIGERIYVPGTEISELLLFKGNDADTAGNGPDRIRLAGVGGVVFDTCDGTSFSSTFEGVGVSTYLTTKMALTQAGNLGIGITNPTSRLHISSAGITTGEALQVDGNIRVGISTTSNYITFRGTYDDGVNAEGKPQSAYYQPYTTTFIGERVYVPGSELSELLIFKGNDSIPAFGPDRIRLASSGEIRFDTVNTALGYPDDRSFEGVGISTKLSNRMTITQPGNIGIGTTVPTSKLHVQGEVRVTGLSTFGGNILPSANNLTIGDPDNKWNKLYINEIIGDITGAASSIKVYQDSSSNNVNYISFVDTTSGISSLRTNSLLVYTPSSGNLGIGTTNALTPIQVERYGVKTGFGTFVASAGITTDVDSFLITNTNFKTAEYTIHIESSSSIQAQKVLVMQNGISAFSQEYAVMYNPTLMVSIGATVSGGLCKLQFTPEIGISELMTYRFTRQSMI